MQTCLGVVENPHYFIAKIKVVRSAQTFVAVKNVALFCAHVSEAQRQRDAEN